MTNVAGAAAWEYLPAFRWTTQSGSTGCEQGSGLAVDAAGNCYQTGTVNGDARFGEIVLPNRGVSLAKYDRDGNLQWAKAAAEGAANGPAVVAIDGQGNLYVTCHFYGETVNVGGILVTNPAAAGLVIAKYDASGAVLWARVAGWATDGLYPSALVADQAGHCYWSASWLSGSATIDGTPVTGNGVVVKCGANGSTLWVAPFDASGFGGMPDLAADPNGNLYAAGKFAQSATFGTTNLAAPGSSAMFLAKYDSEGRVLWVRQGGSEDANDWCRGSRIAVDSAGNCLVNGAFFGNASFGEITLSNSVATSHYFVAKYDPSGRALWARQLADGSTRSAVAVDGQGNCALVAEQADGNVQYVRYDSAGGTLWTRTLPQTLWLTSLRSDASGHCYLSGSFFSPQLAFDDFTLTNQGCSDMFLARFDTATPCLSIKLVTNTIRLSWLAEASEFSLESATSLSPSASWSSNAVTPTVLGSSNVVILPADNPLNFYRLRRP